MPLTSDPGSTCGEPGQERWEEGPRALTPGSPGLSLWEGRARTSQVLQIRPGPAALKRCRPVVGEHVGSFKIIIFFLPFLQFTRIPLCADGL